ncbi:MAG: hypothetical protein D6812_14795 [Deltaproteobacteria bacterium]|nr:MAG: hypothetical protein D6812_14795 [Deltaproteobacteria bacterium]
MHSESGKGNGFRIVVLILFVTWPWGGKTLLHAQDARSAEDHLLAEGISFYRELEYERALSSFRRLLDGAVLSRTERARVLVAIGATHVVLEEEDAAMSAFLEAFSTDPDVRLFSPFEAPKIREGFEKARKRFEEEIQRSDQESPRIFFTPLAERIRGNTPLQVSATVVDNIKVVEVRFSFRRAGDLAYTTIRMTPMAGDRYVVSIPPFMVTGEALEYYLEARDVAGNVTLDGNEKHPYVVEIIPPKTPWYRQGFTWIAAAGTAASILALYLVVRQDPDVLALDGTIEGTIGTVTTTPGVLDAD